MSLYDYVAGRDLAATDPPFYALIQAAMRRADTQNARLLQLAFPSEWADLEARYHAPGGILPSDNYTADPTEVPAE